MSFAKLLGTDAPTLVKERTALVNELKETHEDRVLCEVILGVPVEIRPRLTERARERASVLLGEEKLFFADEWTSFPFSFLKPITVSYWVWIDVDTKQKAETLLKQAGVKDGSIAEDPYADPTRWHVWVTELEDVVKLFKLCVPDPSKVTDKWKL